MLMQPPPFTSTLAPRAGDAARVEAFIPTPCVQNHAASLLELPDGTLLATWFGGTQEGVPDISVHLSRLAPGAARWSDAVRLSDDPTRSEQNPLPWLAPDGALWLLWTAQLGGNQDTAIIRRRISRDGGLSWGPVEVLFDTPGLFIRAPIVVARDGAWLLPVWRCTKPAQGPWTGDLDTSSVMVSEDAGATWAEHPVPGSLGAVHMAILDTGADYVAFFRSRRADFVQVSRSADGRAWSAPAPLHLPNNNSSVAAARLASGHIALVYNHSSREDATGRRLSLYDDIGGEDDAPRVTEGAFWGAPRAPITLALSDDGGRSFPHRRNLEEGDGFCMTNNSQDKLNREFSYPAIIQARDGRLHLAFTFWRQSIKHVTLHEEWAL